MPSSAAASTPGAPDTIPFLRGLIFSFERGHFHQMSSPTSTSSTPPPTPTAIPTMAPVERAAAEEESEAAGAREALGVWDGVGVDVGWTAVKSVGVAATPRETAETGMPDAAAAVWMKGANTVERADPAPDVTLEPDALSRGPSCDTRDVTAVVCVGSPLRYGWVTEMLMTADVLLPLELPRSRRQRAPMMLNAGDRPMARSIRRAPLVVSIEQVPVAVLARFVALRYLVVDTPFSWTTVAFKVTSASDLFT